MTKELNSTQRSELSEQFVELVDNVISNPTPVINNQGGQS